MARSSKSRKFTRTRSLPRESESAGICFTIMPFGGWFDDYYEQIYLPAIQSSGLVAKRADDLFRPSAIVHDIWELTKQAKVVLAELSGRNPNVFYELGLAHALAKPAILVAESMEDVPFDLRALRVLVYDKNAPDWGKILQEKVQAAIGEVLRSPAEAVLPAFLETKGAAPKPTVTPQEKEFLELRQQVDLLREELRNPERIHHPGTDIGPEAARALIREYVTKGMPEGMIIRRVSPLGPPANWVVTELRKLRFRGRRK